MASVQQCNAGASSFAIVHAAPLRFAECHAGLRTRNLDVKALQAVFELLQSHYPERLHALWFLNAPFIFWGVWRMVRLLTIHTHFFGRLQVFPIICRQPIKSEHPPW